MGGERRSSSDDATIEVRDPATGEPFADEVASASKDDVIADRRLG